MHRKSKIIKRVPLFFLFILSLLFVGCGDSEDFVVTRPGPQPTVGSLTFQFVKAQQTFTAPTQTTDIRFELFSGTGGNGQLLNTISRDFTTEPITIEASLEVSSVVITYLDEYGIPRGEATIDVVVTPGQNSFVEPPSSGFRVPELVELTATPEQSALIVDQTQQITVVASFDNGDVVELTGITDIGLTYDPTAPNVASVSDAGLITALFPGSTDIQVSLSINDSSDSDTVSVEIAGESMSTDFSGFTTGQSVNGQQGWSNESSALDEEIVDVSDFRTEPAFSDFGPQALRLSSNSRGSAFDQIFAPLLDDSAGETEATARTFDEGTRFNTFELSFDFATTTSSHQPDLKVNVSPDLGDGSRMSYLSFEDLPAGVSIIFDGTVFPYTPSPTTVIATEVSRNVPHKIRLVLMMNDGDGNDVVEVYLDGDLIHTAGSFESYYRYSTGYSGPPIPPVVKTVLFHVLSPDEGGAAGGGFLFTNLVWAVYDS